MKFPSILIPLAACGSLALAGSTTGFLDAPFPHDVHLALPLASEAANDVRALTSDARQRVFAATRAGVFVLPPGGKTWLPFAEGQALAPAFAVAADTTGSVWIGAWNGLFRVDGDTARPLARMNRPISAIGAYEDGLIVSGPDGVGRIRGSTSEDFNVGCTHYVNGVLAASDRSLYLATKMGLFRWVRDAGHSVRPDPDEVSVDVRGVAFDHQGKLWAAVLGGLEVFEGEGRPRTLTSHDGLPSMDVRRVRCAPDGRIWAGTALGLARLDGSRWTVRQGRRWLLSDDVRDLHFTPDGVAWIATAAGVSVLRQTNLTLAAKAAQFHQVLEARHVRPPGIVEKCRLAKPGDLSTHSPMDDDNDGSYTAVYLAMESYRYAATHDLAALAGARHAFQALELLHRVTDTDGFVARTVVPASWKEVNDANEVLPDPQWAEERVREPRSKRVPVRWHPSADGQWLWKGDTSSDEISGHLFGYLAFYELAADAGERARVKALVCRVVDHLIAHGYNLTDVDGVRTRWGVWAPERLNDDPDWAMDRGVNSVELLSFLKLAYQVSGDAKYQTHYQELIDRHHYDRNTLSAPTINPAWRTHIDSELLAFAYPALLRFETNPRLLATYRASFERWHDSIRVEHNPFWEFLYAVYHRPDKAGMAGAFTFLQRVPLDLVRWSADSSPREDVRHRRAPELEAWQTERLLPPDEINFTRHDQNPWLASQGDGGLSEADGVFYLLPYWMGRHYGFIAAPKP